MELTLAKLSQFLMSESTAIIFLDHIDDIKDDMCCSSKKIQLLTKGVKSNKHFLVKSFRLSVPQS